MKIEYQEKNNHQTHSSVSHSYDSHEESLSQSKKGTLIQRFFSEENWDEFKELISLSLPTIITSMSHFVMLMISTIMCGHLDKYQMDAAALGNGMISVFGIEINLGFSTACDTLFSQYYGSSQKKKMGLFLQRAFVVATPILLLLTAVHLNLEQILNVLGQDPLIAKMAAQYSLLFIPGLYFDFMFTVLARYMQNQCILYPPLLAALFGIAVNVVTQYVAIYIFDYGYEASAVCQMIAFGSAAMFELVYIIATGVCEETWDGWKFREMWEDHGSFYMLAIPGIFMICFEEWSFEIGTILAGILGPVQLAAQSIVFQIEAVLYTISIGICIAVNIRVGNQLASGCPDGARRSYLVGLSLSAITATFSASICIGLSTYLAKIFTSDKEVIATASTVILLLGVIQFLDGIAMISGGALRGCGRQSSAALCVFIGFYLLAVPIGGALALATHLEVIGIWIGLIIGMSVEAIGFIYLLVRLDWQEESRRAIERVGDDTPSQSSLEDDCPSEYFSLDERSYIIKKQRHHRRYSLENCESQLCRHTPSRPRRHYNSMLNVFMKPRPRSKAMSETTPLLTATVSTGSTRRETVKLVVTRMLTFTIALLLVAVSAGLRFDVFYTPTTPCSNSTASANGTVPFPC